jgi:hypothetical protein
MPTEDTTAGGFGDDAFNSGTDTADNPGGIGGDTAGEADWFNHDKSELDYLNSLQDRALSAGASPYGQNAAQRWSGTPAIGLSIFKPRSPVYGPTARGGIRQRIDGSTHFATPPEGVIGGRALQSVLSGGPASSLTPQDQWDTAFPRQQRTQLVGGGGNGVPMVTGGAETNHNGVKTVQSQYGVGSSYAY